MARKKKHAHGGHGWFVTFADLMALLMSFFVAVAAASTTDRQRMAAVAGSMRDAFGQAGERRLAGLIEIGGVPTRSYQRDVAAVAGTEDQQQASEARAENRRSGPEAEARDRDPTRSDRARAYSSAAASLRQAWQALPEVAALSQNIVVEETPDGLAIQLVDQDGRSMFPDGSRYPYERTRAALQALGPVLARLPNPVAISGHTAARPPGRSGGPNAWDLSSERANTVRQILTESGLATDRIAGVSGRAESDPYMPMNPAASPNSRVTILLQHRAPPLPSGLRP